MQKTSMLLIVVGSILSACIAFETAPRRQGDGFDRGAPESWRGAVGNYCPPKQATKGYC